MRQRILLLISILLLNCSLSFADEKALPDLPPLPSSYSEENAATISDEQLTFFEKAKIFFGFGEVTKDKSIDLPVEIKLESNLPNMPLALSEDGDEGPILNQSRLPASSQGLPPLPSPYSEENSATISNEQLTFFEKAKIFFGFGEVAKDKSIDPPIETKLDSDPPIQDPITELESPAPNIPLALSEDGDEGPIVNQPILPLDLKEEGNIKLPTIPETLQNSAKEFPESTNLEENLEPIKSLEDMLFEEGLELPDGFENMDLEDITPDLSQDLNKNIDPKLIPPVDEVLNLDAITLEDNAAESTTEALTPIAPVKVLTENLVPSQSILPVDSQEEADFQPISVPEAPPGQGSFEENTERPDGFDELDLEDKLELPAGFEDMYLEDINSDLPQDLNKSIDPNIVPTVDEVLNLDPTKLEGNATEVAIEDLTPVAPVAVSTESLVPTQPILPAAPQEETALKLPPAPAILQSSSEEVVDPMSVEENLELPSELADMKTDLEKDSDKIIDQKPITPVGEAIIEDKNSDEITSFVPQVPEEDNSKLAIPNYSPDLVEPTINISKYNKEIQSKQKSPQLVDKITSKELEAGVNNFEKFTDVAEADLDETQLEFVNNEAQMLILSNDDIVLGELTQAAKLELMDFRLYIKLFWDQYSRIKAEGKRGVIEEFIENYDENFYEEEYSYDQDEERGAFDEAVKSIAKGNIYSLMFLLNNYDILQVTGGGGNTLLHKAVYVGDYSAAKLLIIKGIDMLAKNKRNKTALDIARKLKHKDIVLLLKSSKLK